MLNGNTNIIIHVMPWELNALSNIVWQLKLCFNYYPEGQWLDENKVTITVLLNTSNKIFDWNNSAIDINYVIANYKNILTPLLDIPNVNVEMLYDPELNYMGVNDLRRMQTNNYNKLYDYFIYLDPDMFFSKNAIFTLIKSANAISSTQTEYFILTPQTIKLWDNSWDAITNDKFIQDEPSMDKYVSFDPYKMHDYEINNGNFTLVPNELYTKIGGGWLNLISSNLFRDYINIPKSLGGYGVDDTYLAVCCDILKTYNVCNYTQFILNGLVVTENRKYKIDKYKSFYKQYNNNLVSDQRDGAIRNMQIELEHFKNKYKEGLWKN